MSKCFLCDTIEMRDGIILSTLFMILLQLV